VVAHDAHRARRQPAKKPLALLYHGQFIDGLHAFMLCRSTEDEQDGQPCKTQVFRWIASMAAIEQNDNRSNYTARTLRDHHLPVPV
jgi:hypothetical protein